MTTETAEPTVSEELWKQNQYIRLFDFTIYEATQAVNLGVDYHDVDTFCKQHPECSPQTAVRILA